MVISYRVHLMFKAIKDREVSARGSGRYACPSCKAQWDPLEAMACQSEDGTKFLCVNCKRDNDSRLDAVEEGEYELRPVDDREEVIRAICDEARLKEQLEEKIIFEKVKDGTFFFFLFYFFALERRRGNLP